MMMNCMNSNNADLKMIINVVDSLQRNSNIKSKYLHNDEKYINNIIDFLTQILTSKKGKSKDYL